MKKNLLRGNLFFWLMVVGAFALMGCAAPQTVPPEMHVSAPAEKIDWSRLPPPPKKKELVAVAGFENKSTYSADKLWDTSSRILATYLLRSGYFRVVEWSQMKRLFDWDTLSAAGIIKSPENMKKAQRVLLCEDFISGSITYFDVRQNAQVSAISKQKTIVTTIRVDLLLQSAMSGEYLAAGTGEAAVRQIYQGGLSGGQTGSWDPALADRALDLAIGKALFELIENYHQYRG